MLLLLLLLLLLAQAGAAQALLLSPSDEDDPALSFIRHHAMALVSELQIDGHFARAADEGRPSNYTVPRARDLAFLVDSAGDVLQLDGAASALAVADGLRLLHAAPRLAEPSDELPARAWLLAGLANHTNSSLLCAELPAVWAQLQDHYANASRWHDGLSFSAAVSVAGVETVLSSGHDTFLSLLHYQALESLASAAEHTTCSGLVPAMRAVQHTIESALNDGPLLWNESSGMFRPSSGNNAHLTDVWGSALAVDSGAVTGERAARIVEWFGAHWTEVVQDGQVRHLPAFGDAGGMPSGEYWPDVTTWQYNTFANGGFWGTASGWVLPVIARNDSALGQKLVRDAIGVVQRDGSLSEWQNAVFCCNCEGAASFTSVCMTPYPSTASLSGAARYGRSVFSVYSAAKRLLAAVDEVATDVVALLPVEPTAPLTLHAQVTALAGREPTLGVDPDMAWLTEYATMYQAQARECTGCTDCVQPPYDGCFFPPAADPGRPAAYSALWTRDFEYTMEFLYPLFDETSKQAALDQTLYILKTRAAARVMGQNCSAPHGHSGTPVCTSDEPMFQTKLVVNLANFTQNKTLFCSNFDMLWRSLNSVYVSASFKDDLVWTVTPTNGYGFTDSILKSGHHLFDSVLHAQVLGQLADMSKHFSCGDAAPARAVRARIVSALAGPLLWNESSGMFRPSSGNNAHLTDVWGSALAVDTGSVTGERAARIVEWFGAHWTEVVQDGQVKHLGIGEHWAQHAFWEYDVYQNGGFWGTPSGWVLPVIARNDSAVAEQLVRDAINDCRRNGINEWHNNDYCSNCAGELVTNPAQLPPLAAGEKYYTHNSHWFRRSKKG